MANNMIFPGMREPEVNLKAHYAFIKLKMKLGMENPYEDKKEEFSADLLKSKANELREIRGRYDSYVQKMPLPRGRALELLWQK
jgi:hypothetical protein